MKTFFFLAAVVLCMASCSREPAADEPGTTTYNVSGYVVDNLNARQAAQVSLISAAETENMTTGSNGAFNFTSVARGVYTVKATKDGYNGASEEVTVNNGNVNVDALILTIKPSEIITKQDTLDFGESHNSLTLSFQILSYLDDDWSIMHNCSWIQKIEPANGKHVYNEKEKTPPTITVSVQIDREKLAAGKNDDKIQITTSSNGGADIIVVAYNISYFAVSTKDASQVTSNSATFSGTITDVGTPAYTERGFVYDINSISTQAELPTTARKVTKEKNAEVDYSVNVSGLLPNTTYHVRAFVANDNGTVYGNEVSFTSGAELATLSTSTVTNIHANSAEFGGNIITPGLPPYTERGFVWATSQEPTITNSTGKQTAEINSNTAFSIHAVNLASSTIYHVCAYAQNSHGISYGNVISFSTEGISSEVITSSVSDIGISSAVLHGNITVEGSPTYSEKGFCYGINSNPTIADNKKIVAAQGTGAYLYNLSGLEYQTTYYVKAYVIQNGTVLYGNVVSFKTIWVNTAVTTSAVTNIDITSATLHANITAAGNPAYTERGFCYGTNSTPTIADNRYTIFGSGAGPYSLDVNGLNYQTTYFVRAYAMQNGEVIYGNVVSFTTYWESAVVMTTGTTNVVIGSVRFNAIITNMGWPQYSERGFCLVMKTFEEIADEPDPIIPTIADIIYPVSGNGTGAYSLTLTALDERDFICVRPYLKQGTNVVYGETDYVPTATRPVVTTNTVENVTTTSATLIGHISVRGSPAYTARGFVVAINTNMPTLSTPNTANVTVPGDEGGLFGMHVINISSGTTYYVRAYATNSHGTGYGQTVSFTTHGSK
jgi:hypothetical protein